MKYDQILSTVRAAYIDRIAAMVRAGKTVEEAKASIKAENDRRFVAASARAKCGITSKPSTIGEILAAKAR